MTDHANRSCHLDRFRRSARPLARVVAAGDALLAPSITHLLVEDFARVQPVLPAAATDLTPRETDVLRLVARGQAVVYAYVRVVAPGPRR